MDELSVLGTSYTNDNHDYARLDLTDPAAVNAFFQSNKPDAIVYLAGCKNVRLCEEQPEVSRAVNVDGLANTLDAIRQFCPASQLLYLSTDYVFDGEVGSYCVTDTPNPQTAYGKDKLAAEKLLRSSGLDNIILRTSAVMGRGGVFFEWLMSSLRQEGSVEMFSNVYFSPTPMQLLNEAIAFLLSHFEEYNRSIVHVSYPERLSRYDFAVICQQALGAQSAARCVAVERSCDGSYFPNDLSLIPSLPQLQLPARTLEGYLRDVL